MTRQLVIAHCAGNDLDTLRSLDLGADLVEADIDAYRGHLEVRQLLASVDVIPGCCSTSREFTPASPPPRDSPDR